MPVMKRRSRFADTDNHHWPRQLREGLLQMRLQLSPQQQEQLLAYLTLLNKWNRTYNLTAIRDPAQMVSRQLLDSLSILPWIRGPRVLDVGTGAGLPGIPLAIALPEMKFLLLDANGKKTRFVQQVISELGLENVSVRQIRVEKLSDLEGFDTIVSRAFADLHEMLALTANLRAREGQWAAMKGGLAEFDPQGLPPGMDWRVLPLQVPGEAGERNLVLIGPGTASARGQGGEGPL